MDLLKKQVFDSIRSTKTGDSEIDSCVENLSRYVIGALNNYEDAVSKIEAKRNLYTPAGIFEQKQKARKKALEEVSMAFEKSSWLGKIDEIRGRIDTPVDRDPITLLIQESRERETRQYLLQYKDDLPTMAAFQQRILDGDPVAVQAVLNSPFDVFQVPADVLEAGIKKMRLKMNPLAADRLAVLEQAQDTRDQLKRFFDDEIGGDDDTIVELAAGD